MPAFSLDPYDKVKLFNLAQATGYMSLVLRSSGVKNIQVEQMSDSGIVYYKTLTPKEIDEMAEEISEMFELGELEDEFLHD